MNKKLAETCEMDKFAKRLPVLSLRIAGWLLIFSGIAHLALFAINGGDWEGDTSLRKPILFGISSGVTLLSIVWIVPRLRPRWGDSTIRIAFSVAMTVEVTLITLKQWRGVPSHFNRDTPLDAMILNTIEGLILFVTIVIADLTWRSLRDVEASSDIKLAVRGGMVLLLFGCLLGILSAIYGVQQKSLGRPPGIYGEAGVMKFAHGMPLHAIQFLPAIAWVLKKFEIGEPKRRRTVLLSLCSLCSTTAFSCVQTFSGKARFELTLLSTPILIVAGLLILWSPFEIVFRVATKLNKNGT